MHAVYLWVVKNYSLDCGNGMICTSKDGRLFKCHHLKINICNFENTGMVKFCKYVLCLSKLKDTSNKRNLKIGNLKIFNIENYTVAIVF